MGYSPITLLPRTTITAAGSGSVWDVATGALATAGRLRVVVGQPTDLRVSVALEVSTDSGSTWQPLITPGEVPAGQSLEWTAELPGGAYQARLAWQVQGAGNRTLEAHLEPMELLATPEDLAGYGLPPSLLSRVDPEVQIRQLVAGSAVVLSALSAVTTAPLTGVGVDLRQAVSKLAAAEILIHAVGVNPSPQATQAVLDAAAATRTWLRDLAAGRARADYTDATPDTEEELTTTAGAVVGEPLRRWSNAAP